MAMAALVTQFRCLMNRTFYFQDETDAPFFRACHGVCLFAARRLCLRAERSDPDLADQQDPCPIRRLRRTEIAGQCVEPDCLADPAQLPDRGAEQSLGGQRAGSL